MQKTICVFCSSSSAVDEVYFEAARALGRAIAEQGWGLVYGGSDVGLMGAVARAVHLHKGTVVGIIPQTIHARGIAYETADELLITKDLRERKAEMERRADAFIALPGGFGTLEEIVEVLTLKQLQTHAKPILFLNTNGFYDPLMTLFEHYYQQQFAKPDSRALYYVAADVSSAVEYIATYQPPVIQSKWFG
ncbi:MAG: TIGR00730 family Rossman fold protein [Chloroflexota bacterium]